MSSFHQIQSHPQISRLKYNDSLLKGNRKNNYWQISRKYYKVRRNINQNPKHMKQTIAKIFLKLLGWEIKVENPQILTERKYILLAAPHTSAWDFIIGKTVYLALGLESKFFIKDSFFKGPIGKVLKKMGGIPINQNSPREAVKMMNEIKNLNEIRLIITPEGTRQKTTKWNNGFYSIAKKTGIPVYIGILDFGSKTCFLGNEFIIRNDFEEDMKQLRNTFHKKQAKHPEKFTLHGENE